MQKIISMTDGKPVYRIAQFSGPLIIGNILQQAYSIVDASVVGRGISINALAAVGGTSWVVWLILAGCRDIGNAVCVVGAKRVGARDARGLADVMLYSMKLWVILSVIFSSLFLAFLNQILIYMNIRAEIYEDARVYLLFYILQIPFILLFNLASALLRAVGNSRPALTSMTVSTVVNIVLDILFVLKFRWGVAGAAIATMIAQGSASLAVLIPLLRSGLWRAEGESSAMPAELNREVVLFALPTFLNDLIIAFGGVYMQQAINAVGAGFAAGYTSGTKIFHLTESVIIAIQSGASVFVGQHAGARKWKRLRKGLREIVLASVVLTLFMSAALIGTRTYIIPLFLAASDPELYRIAFTATLQYLAIMGICFPVMTAMYIMRITIQTLGKAKIALYAGILQSAIRVLTVNVLSLIGGHIMYFMATPLAWVVTLVIVSVSYRKLIIARCASEI